MHEELEENQSSFLNFDSLKFTLVSILPIDSRHLSEKSVMNSKAVALFLSLGLATTLAACGTARMGSGEERGTVSPSAQQGEGEKSSVSELEAASYPTMLLLRPGESDKSSAPVQSAESGNLSEPSQLSESGKSGESNPSSESGNSSESVNVGRSGKSSKSVQSSESGHSGRSRKSGESVRARRSGKSSEPVRARRSHKSEDYEEEDHEDSEESD